jgi:membrane-associated phospholipid phosphatase
MIKKRIWFFFFLIIVVSTSIEVLAQSPYRLDAVGDGIFSGASIGLLTFGRVKYKKIQPLTMEEINKLSREDLFGIDRPATYQHSIISKKWSDYALRTSFVMPFSMLAGDRSRKDFGRAGLITLETILLNTALTDVAKVLARRTRPLAYNESYGMHEKMMRNTRTSFFSGHTSSVAAMYFLTAKLYSDYYPDSKIKPVVWTVAVLVPAATGYLRIKAGKHYFTDVLAGFVVGAAVGLLVPELHRVK